MEVHTVRAIAAAVGAIQGMLWSDSNVMLDEDLILEAVMADEAYSGTVPNQRECELLVMGDDDGEVPRALQEQYPSIDMLLEEQF